MAATPKAWQGLAIRRVKEPQHIVVEMVVGWAGATEGFKMVFSRIRTVGTEYSLEKAEHRGQGMDTSRVPEGVPGGEQVKRGHGVDKLYSFGSIDHTEETLAQAFNKWKDHVAGYYAGKPRS